MEQPFDKLLMFRNRLQKVYRHISRQAARMGVGCYRIYDHDLPEAPLLIERYEDHLYVSEYKRKHQLSEEAHAQWLSACTRIIEDVTGIAPERMHLRLRQRKAGRHGQYQKLEAKGAEFAVREGQLHFLVNLDDYLDTGLFLDHRATRALFRELSSGKEVLNLFCYTGSFSVYALAGGARKVHSVDLSRTYLAWTERNVALNFPDGAPHEAIHVDAIRFLSEAPAGSYDLIMLDPPTFSNSKRMDEVLDIQRDHPRLIRDALRLLRPGGTLFFSNNFTKFSLSAEPWPSATVRDITKATTPFDFTGKLRRYCFRFDRDR